MTTKMLLTISEDPQKYLSQVFDVRKAIIAKQARIDTLRGIAESITPNYSPVPGGGGSTEKVPNCVASILEAQTELQADIDRLNALCKEISAVIDMMVGDQTSRTVLELRYCAMLQWPDVAKSLDKTLRWVMTLHERAIKELTANCLQRIFQST